MPFIFNNKFIKFFTNTILSTQNSLANHINFAPINSMFNYAAENINWANLSSYVDMSLLGIKTAPAKRMSELYQETVLLSDNSLAAQVRNDISSEILNALYKKTTQANIYDNLTQENLGYTLNLALAGGIGYVKDGPVGMAISVAAAIADEKIIEKYAETYTKHYLFSGYFWGSLALPTAQTIYEALPSIYKYPITAAALGAAGALTHFNDDILSYHKMIAATQDTLVPVRKLVDPKNILSFNEYEKIRELYNTDPEQAKELLYEDVKYALNHPLVQTLITNMVTSLLRVGFLKFIINSMGSDYGMHMPHLINNLKEMGLKQHNSTAAKSFNFDIMCLEGLEDGIFKFSDAINKSLTISKYFILDLLVGNIFKHIKLKSSAAFGKYIKDVLDEKILFNADKSLKLLTIENGKELINEIPSTISFSWQIANNNIEAGFEDKFTTLVSLEKILKLSPEYFIFNSLLGLVKQKTSEYLKSNITKIKAKTSDLTTKKNSMETEVVNNIDKILTSGITEQTNQIHKNLKEKIENTTNNASLMAIVEEGVEDGLKKVNVLLNFLFFTLKYLAYNIKIDDIITLETLFYSAKKVTSSPTIQYGSSSREKVLKVLDALLNDEEYMRPFEHNNENKIIIKDFKMTDGKGAIISEIPNLEIDTNQYHRVVIKARSGWGKSTLLKIMTLEVASAPLQYEGTIELFNNKDGVAIKPLMFNQDFWIPSYMSLFEHITGKAETDLTSVEKQYYTQKITNLFREIRIDTAAVEGRDASSIIKYLSTPDAPRISDLSGGQRAKISFVKAIMQEAEFIIFDETFANLDVTSIENIQCMLLKYLPNSVMLVIDHQASTNNCLGESAGFYEAIVDVSKSTGVVPMVRPDDSLEGNQKQLLYATAVNLYNINKQIDPNADNLTFDIFCHNNFPDLLHKMFPGFDLSNDLLNEIIKLSPTQDNVNNSLLAQEHLLDTHLSTDEIVGEINIEGCTLVFG